MASTEIRRGTRPGPRISYDALERRWTKSRERLSDPWGPGGIPHYDYRYPEGRDLRPNAPLHDWLVKQIMERARESRNCTMKRFSRMNEIDELLTSYIPLDEVEQKVQGKDRRKPVSIVVPAAYAALKTFLAYDTMTFLNEPYFRYRGVGPEDVFGADILQAVVNAQCMRHRVGLDLYTMWRDARAYGFGIVSPYWVEERIQRGSRTEVFGGNQLRNHDPYMFLPDPRTPIHQIQKSESVGWIDQTNRTQLLRDEYSNPYRFNARYLAHLDGQTSLFSDSPTDMRDPDDVAGSAYQADVGSAFSPVDVVHMYVDLVPYEWSLGTSVYPERWCFSVAGDTLLVGMQRLELWHNLLPLAVNAPDFDGHEPLPLSSIEVTYGLSKVINYMLNNHVANQRSCINNMFVYNPRLIDPTTVTTDEGGMRAPIRESAQFEPNAVNEALAQLKVTDVTGGNLISANYAFEFLQRGAGTPDMIQGFMAPRGEARTATETSAVRTGAVSRLQADAMLTSLMTMSVLGRLFASHTQQFMQAPQWIRMSEGIAADLAAQYGLPQQLNRFRVEPGMLVDCAFDVLMGDVTMPQAADPQSLMTAMQAVGSSPILAMEYDIGRLFGSAMRAIGIQNMEQFRRTQPESRSLLQAQLMPPDQIQQQADLGNLVQLAGGEGGPYG